MATRYVNIDRDTALLLPPDLRDWVPEDHLVHFVIDAVEQLDVSTARANERGTGSEQYPPGMLLGLLIYSYATGTFSSRQIERLTHENVAVRLLCGDTHPDHDTLCTFRRDNAVLLGTCFAQVLELAVRCGVLKVGGITVAIDGTKILANASKHSAVSYAHADQTMRQLDLEIAQLLRKAEEADATPLADGLTIPEEVRRRQDRKAQLAKARAEMEARAYARFQVEQAEYAAKMAARAAKAAAGKKPRGKPPAPPEPTPGPKDQYNFTDPESRIMKAGSGQHFEQAYNAQAAVEVDSRLIVGQRVCPAPNDKQQLIPTVQAIVPAVGPVKEALIDSGFVSEAAVRAVEVDAAGQPTGLTVLAALQREAHGRTVTQLERRDDPLPPAPGASFAERMIHRTATAAGRIRYKLRQQTVEPTFGIIKEVLGFRRFSLRGEPKAALEWTLVTLAFNMKRLHALGVHLTPA
jgi:transposase